MDAAQWTTPPVIMSIGGAIVTVAGTFAVMRSKLLDIEKQVANDKLELKAQYASDKVELKAQLAADKLEMVAGLNKVRGEMVTVAEFEAKMEVFKLQYQNITAGQARVEGLFGDILKSVLKERHNHD